MKKPVQLVTRLATVAMAAGLVTACATVTPEQLDEVRATANNALSEARAAQGAANNALNRASEAAEAARRAQTTADAAQACCNDNTEKLERILQGTMQK